MANQEPDLLTDIRTRLMPVLDGYGFEVHLLSYIPENFGNCQVELTSPRFVLTVTRDRGQVFVDVASTDHPERRYWLGELIAFLEAESDPRAMTDLDSAISSLRTHRDRILSSELLVERSSDLAVYRREFNKRRWGADRVKE